MVNRNPHPSLPQSRSSDRQAERARAAAEAARRAAAEADKKSAPISRFVDGKPCCKRCRSGVQFPTPIDVRNHRQLLHARFRLVRRSGGDGGAGGDLRSRRRRHNHDHARGGVLGRVSFLSTTNKDYSPDSPRMLLPDDRGVPAARLVGVLLPFEV